MFFQNIIKIRKKYFECKFCANIGHNLGLFTIFSEIGTILGTKTLKNAKYWPHPLQNLFNGAILNFKKLNGLTKKKFDHIICQL